MLRPDGKLNVDLLRKEIASDVSLHDRYRAEDAMKKRAIHSSELVRCRAYSTLYLRLDSTRLDSLLCRRAILTNRSFFFSFTKNSGQNYEEFRNLVLASQLKPVNQEEMSQLFSGGGGGGDAATVGSIKSRVGNCGAMNKAFNIGYRGNSGGSGGIGGIGGSYDPSMAAADRGRAALATSSFSQSSPSDTAKAGGGRGSLFDQSTPAELEGLDWKQLQKKMAKKGSKKSSKKTSKGKKSSGGASLPPSSPPSKINPLQFEREWRRSCTDAASTAQYLLRTEIIGDDDGDGEDYSLRPCSSAGSKRRLILRPEEAPRTVFKVEIGSDIMGDILSALAYLCRFSSSSSSSLKPDLATEAETGTGSNDDTVMSSFSPSFAYRWMISMTKCGRFGLNVSFLTEEQKQDVEFILALLEQHRIDGKVDLDDDETDKLCGGCFTEEDIMRLGELYK